MKKLFITLLIAIFMLPLPAAAQKWIEPSMQPDGTMVPGHWSTTEEGWQNLYATPGTMDPFTGKFNTFGRKNQPYTPTQTAPSSNILPGSNAANSYAIPGSTAPNPYLIPGSKVANPYSALSSIPYKPTREGQAAGNPQ